MRLCQSSAMQSERPPSRFLIAIFVVVSVAALGLGLWDVVRQAVDLWRG